MNAIAHPFSADVLTLSRDDFQALLCSAEMTQRRIQEFCKTKRSAVIDPALSEMMRAETEQWVRITEYLRLMIATTI